MQDNVAGSLEGRAAVYVHSAPDYSCNFNVVLEDILGDRQPVLFCTDNHSKRYRSVQFKRLKEVVLLFT